MRSALKQLSRIVRDSDSSTLTLLAKTALTEATASTSGLALSTGQNAFSQSGLRLFTSTACRKCVLETRPPANSFTRSSQEVSLQFPTHSSNLSVQRHHYHPFQRPSLISSLPKPIIIIIISCSLLTPWFGADYSAQKNPTVAAANGKSTSPKAKPSHPPNLAPTTPTPRSQSKTPITDPTARKVPTPKSPSNNFNSPNHSKQKISST